MAVLAGLFVIHTMLIVRPDTVVSKIHTNYLIASVMYSLITFSTIVIWTEFANRFLARLLKNWKVYNELALTISCILAMGILNYAYILFFGDLSLSFPKFSTIAMWEVVSFTLGSGLIPLLLFTLINFLRLEIKRKQIDNATVPLQKEEEITPMLRIQEGGEEIHLDLSKIFLIESMGNYMKIYENRDNIRNTLIARLTMKRLEELILEQKFMMRVHRSYFVNTNHIEHVQRSSFGDLTIHFEYKNLAIPVSRNKKKDLNNILRSRNIHIKTEKVLQDVPDEVLQSSI